MDSLTQSIYFFETVKYLRPSLMCLNSPPIPASFSFFQLDVLFSYMLGHLDLVQHEPVDVHVSY